MSDSDIIRAAKIRAVTELHALRPINEIVQDMTGPQVRTRYMTAPESVAELEALLAELERDKSENRTAAHDPDEGAR